MSKEEYDQLPDTMTVREFRVNGINFVTTLLDPKQFHKKEMSSLYHQRRPKSYPLLTKPRNEAIMDLSNQLVR